MTQSTLTSFLAPNHHPFSIYNLPYGVFKPHNQPPRVGCAIGDFVLDLALLEQRGVIQTGVEYTLFATASLNEFAAQKPALWALIRAQIQSLLSVDDRILQDDAELLESALWNQCDVTMMLPFYIRGFTDFYASEHHASNVGRLFRANEAPLLPNWKRLPVAYNGRASTVVVSGTPIKRPWGQTKAPEHDAPTFAPCAKMDYELELGLFIGRGNLDAKPITIATAQEHLFGVVLLDDWSARDIQAFEYQPLGPFLGKSFATSISPWVVPMAALTDFMRPMPEQDPKPVSYLYDPKRCLPDIHLEVAIMPAGEATTSVVTHTNAHTLYWSFEQMLAHHTVNGCVMNTGDLLGTGTISGATQTQLGSLLELSLNGKAPIDSGQTQRSFLEDGDKVIMSAYCECADYRIGFGSVEGMITPAHKE